MSGGTTLLTETVWRDQPAWTLENDHLRVITVPGMGAKIVSLYNKQAQHEWLVALDDRPFKPAPYGSVFIDQDLTGWDEMFPTINTCVYPLPGPFKGTPLPDHGEVWPLPWDVMAAGSEQLQLGVNGRALPYRLNRTMTLGDSGSLRLDYELHNTGSEPLVSLWAAHPQFVVSPEIEIRLPPDIRRVANVLDGEEWGRPGQRYDWPTAVNRQGKTVHLNRVAPPTAHNYRKMYNLPQEPVGWAALHEPDHLRFDWDSAKVPYLGLWVDEGGISPKSAVALEPSTAYYDNLTLAWHLRHTPVLPPGEVARWYLVVTVGQTLPRGLPGV